MDDLNIILPVFNEKETIEVVLKEWKRELNKFNFKYYFVICEDGSTDGTKTLLKKIKDKYNLILNQKEKRRGYGGAVIDGIKSAKSKYILCVDSDGQCNPKDFKMFWKNRHRAEIIIGWRVKRADPPNRIVYSLLFKILFWVLFPVKIHDPSASFVLFNRQTINPYLKYLEFLKEGFWWGFVGTCFKKKISFYEIKINHRKRVNGDSQVYLSSNIFSIAIRNSFGLFNLWLEFFKIKNVLILIKMRIFYQLKYIYFWFKDLGNMVIGRRNFIPSLKFRLKVGPYFNLEEYVNIGKYYLLYCKKLCHLQPDWNVLDIGCGYGLMAIQFKDYFNKNGQYYGIDIDKHMIIWTKKNISKYYPNFHFTFADIYNKVYNPKGMIIASQYEFPYKDRLFDIVILTSVFTHMLPKDIENYISEISRVLKKGGYCFMTFFLINKNVQKYINQNLTNPKFAYKYKNYRISNLNFPEAAVGYNENYVLRILSRFKLKMVNTSYGSWPGRKVSNDYQGLQDFILAYKK
jgi:glycosyltransferase involved in cell wall biosynthesis